MFPGVGKTKQTHLTVWSISARLYLLEKNSMRTVLNECINLNTKCVTLSVGKYCAQWGYDFSGMEGVCAPVLSPQNFRAPLCYLLGLHT